MSDDPSIRGVVAATLAQIDEATLPLRKVLAAPDMEESGLAGFLTRLYHQQAIVEIRANGYKTNDIIEIPDDPREAWRESKVSVNGTSLKLKARELLLMFVLARNTRSLVRNRSLTSVPDHGFLNVAALIREMDRVKAEAGVRDLWENAIYTDVHRTISELRGKLSDAGFNRDLIEGRRKLGYRLSVPPGNVIPPVRGSDSPPS
jgi:hypothetical protein